MNGKTLMDKIVTPVFRVSFPEVFEPKSFGGSKEKYSLVMLFDKKTDLTSLKNLARRAVAAKYGNTPPAGLVTPFKDGNTKEYSSYADTIYITATSQYPPGVVDEQKQPIINRADFYAGCYAVASINAFCWKFAGREGVSFGLQNIMKINDGEPLGGGSSPEADFESIELPEQEEVAVTGGGASILDL